MKVTIERTKTKGWFGGTPAITLTTILSEEEKEIIKLAEVGDLTFYEPELHPQGVGNSLREPITFNDIASGKPIVRIPLGFTEDVYLAMERDLETAARKAKSMLDELKGELAKRGKRTLDL